MINNFDLTDIKNLGRPIHFSLESYIETIIGFIRADEIQSALWLLDNPPGWYRDNYPPELTKIRNTIYQNTYDQIEYATDDEEADCAREFGEAQWDNGYMFPRAEVVASLVDKISDEMKIPWIFDLGCSHGNLPLGLIKSKRQFNYYGVGMNHRIQQKVKGWVGERWKEKPVLGQATILYCTEVIEHCFHPEEIVHSAHKLGVSFDHILLSVPMYTLGGGLPNWDSRRMGHVRTWTPREFLAFADKAFPGYSWELYQSPSMVIVGKKNG